MSMTPHLCITLLIAGVILYSALTLGGFQLLQYIARKHLKVATDAERILLLRQKLKTMSRQQRTVSTIAAVLLGMLLFALARAG